MGLRAPQSNIPGSGFQGPPLGPWKMPLFSHASSCTDMVGLSRIPAILSVSICASHAILISLSGRFLWTKHRSRQASRFSHCFPLLPTVGPQRSRPSVWTRPAPSSCGFCSRKILCVVDHDYCRFLDGLQSTNRIMETPTFGHGKAFPMK